MKNVIGYLKAEVIVEPLINQWYAWSYLIPPATASRYLTESHLKVMQSFVDAPEVHETTLCNPAMRGGPFIQYSASRVEEVRSLLVKTKTEQTRLLALSDAIAHLRSQLADHPAGQSLEPLYAHIPEPLKGYVELVYDAHNSASIRLIEGLLYRSEYYNSASQSIALRLADCDQRAFVMSTPRLPDSNSLFLSIPFADSRLDDLFQMRYKAGSVEAIATRLNISKQSQPFFYRLFTPTPLPHHPPYKGDSIRIRYLGHACVLVETADIAILCDPLVSYAHPTGMARYSYTDLPETIDYALITHNHQDHVMLETLLQLRHKIKHVVVPSSQKGSLLDPSLKLALQQIGFTHVLTLDELETIDLPDGKIISIPVLGEHGDLNIATKNAYWITLKGRSILCAADSNNLEPQLYAHIHHLLGDLDLLFLGMECDGAPFTWAYGPLLPHSIPHAQAQTRRLDGSNADRALTLVNQLNPQQVYIYAMGQEPWLTYITSIDYAPDAAPILESNRFIERCREKGRVCDRLLGRHEIKISPKGTTQKSASPIPVRAIAPSLNIESHTTQSHKTQKKPTINPLPTPYSPLPTPNSLTPNSLTPHSLTPDSLTPDSLTSFLSHLQTLDIRLWLEGNTLRCNAPKGILTPNLTAQIKINKPAIMALLKGHATNTSPLKETISTSVDPTDSINPINPISTLAPAGDWQQDIHLPEDIRPIVTDGSKITHLEQNILLTGATGFLGAFLLQELLLQTNATIYCLIRAESPTVGLNKLKQCLTTYQIWQPTFASRIVPVVGDLSLPSLGLSSQQFYTLADQIDTIYHNGAQVHHLSPYSQLSATNVFGTQEIIRLACHGVPKPLHYTSTLSVFPSLPLPGQTKISEQADLREYPVPAGGYNRSKWVAEQLIAQARDRHLPVTIYRPGPISGHSQTGVFNVNDFLYRLMQGYVQSGMAPNGEIPLDLLPVDYAAKALVYLSRQSTALGKAFHLIHPHPVASTLLFDACQSAGYPIKRVSYDIWYQTLKHIAQENSSHPLYPLVALFSSRHNRAEANYKSFSEIPPEIPPETPPEIPPEIPFDIQQTYTYLKNAPFTLPPLNRELFDTYVKAMMQGEPQ